MSAIAATVTSYEERAKKAARRPKLVFVLSMTSGRSRRVEGFLAQVLQRRGNHDTFQVVRVDADSRPDLVERLRVDTVPALLVVEEGRVRARLTAPNGCRDITDALAPWLR
jgi:thioredoxin-like negative regulator of GroEL